MTVDLLTHDAKWRDRFLAMAREVSTWSKDPSTKVGALVVSRDRRFICPGYNGFPQGVYDDLARYEHRPTKLLFMQHAEANAILMAEGRARDAIVYSTQRPCARCAGVMVQAGVRSVCYPETSGEFALRWAEEFEASETILAEAGVSEAVLGDDGVWRLRHD